MKKTNLTQGDTERKKHNTETRLMEGTEGTGWKYKKGNYCNYNSKVIPGSKTQGP